MAKKNIIGIKPGLLVGILVFLMVFTLACEGEAENEGIEFDERETSGIEVISDSGGNIGNGVYEVTGKIQNKNKEEASFVKVKATFYDANQQIIDENEVSVDLDVLPAGEKANFTIDTSKGGIADSVASYKLSVSHR